MNPHAKPFSMLVTIPLKPECVAEYLELVNALNDAMRHEPTFLNTVLSQSIDDPSLIMIHEMWLDQADFFDVQMKRSYRQQYEARLPALLRGQREMKVFNPIRADFAFMSGIGQGVLNSGMNPGTRAPDQSRNRSS